MLGKGGISVSQTSIFCAWIFTRFEGIYSDMSRSMQKTFNLTNCQNIG